MSVNLYSVFNIQAGLCSGLPEEIHLSMGTTEQISSPNYPFNYPNNAECAWIFNSSNNAVFVLNFQEVYTEGEYDFVRTGKGDLPGKNTVMAISGEYVNISVSIEGPIIWIQFESDEIGDRMGFTILVSSELYAGKYALK